MFFVIYIKPAAAAASMTSEGIHLTIESTWSTLQSNRNSGEGGLQLKCIFRNIKLRLLSSPSAIVQIEFTEATEGHGGVRGVHVHRGHVPEVARGDVTFPFLDKVVPVL